MSLAREGCRVRSSFSGSVPPFPLQLFECLVYLLRPGQLLPSKATNIGIYSTRSLLKQYIIPVSSILLPQNKRWMISSKPVSMRLFTIQPSRCGCNRGRARPRTSPHDSLEPGPLPHGHGKGLLRENKVVLAFRADGS